MELKESFDREIMPCIRADGGWLELHREAEDRVCLVAQGECARCAALERCLNWIRERALQDLGQEFSWTVERIPFVWRR